MCSSPFLSEEFARRANGQSYDRTWTRAFQRNTTHVHRVWGFVHVCSAARHARSLYVCVPSLHQSFSESMQYHLLNDKSDGRPLSVRSLAVRGRLAGSALRVRSTQNPSGVDASVGICCATLTSGVAAGPTSIIHRIGELQLG